MCGIVGFKTDRDLERCCQELKDATFSLAHRGPDNSDLFIDNEKGVGLGHRRLSIIDLSANAGQPMGSEDGRFVLVFNGELYNFREIREALEKKGYQFRSNSDTEVVLKAFLEWGIDAVKQFIGMFAFAIWDNQNDRFFLVRDRLGIKPLYYHVCGKTLFFASELKALMAFKSFSKELDLDAVRLFLHYQYIPSPQTVFKNTYKLMPGHWAEMDGDGLKVHLYWQPPMQTPQSDETQLSEGETLTVLERLLTQSVKDRLVSDVPLGALLSGGIDSSLIVALMQKVSTSPVRTFSIGFDVQGYDEAPWAAQIADRLGTDHTELYATQAQAMEIISSLPEVYDEPFADSSAIPTLLVSGLARSGVTVALSGDGGDEQFAGYKRYQATKSMVGISRLLPGFFRRGFSALLKSVPVEWAEGIYTTYGKVFSRGVENFHDKWQKIPDLLCCGGEIPEAYRAAVTVWSKEALLALTGKNVVESQFEGVFRDTQDLPLLERFMVADKMTYLPDDLLTKVDRASMSVSLEVRVPLLDHRVVEYTSQIPETLKFRKGVSKYLLKQILARYVPGKLFDRPKMGFGVPIGKWFREDLKDLLLDYLSPERLRTEGLFRSSVVERKIQEHLSGRANHQHRLWALVMWEMWRERWL